MSRKRTRPGIDQVPLFDVFSEVDAQSLKQRDRLARKREHAAVPSTAGHAPLRLSEDELGGSHFEAQFEEVNRRLLVAINTCQEHGELATLANSFFRGHKTRQELAGSQITIAVDVVENMKALYDENYVNNDQEGKDDNVQETEGTEEVE